MLRRILSESSLSALVAGLVAVIVSYAGPAALMFQAAEAAHLSQAQLSSWIWAISVASGVTGIGLSLRYRVPVITAWSTPGAALLAAGWTAYSYPEAIGAFIAVGVAITVFGVTGLFAAFMDRIPRAVVSAMLAGILFRFCVDVFTRMQAAPLLVAPMLLTWLAARRLAPRYAVLLPLLAGLLVAGLTGQLSFGAVSAAPAVPVFTMPHFTMGALLGLGVPLFVVAMAGQNATGLGVMRASGYNTPGSPLVTWTGVASTLLAPFGSHGVNLAAITAAICTGPEAHADPARRYWAGIFCGGFYVLVGTFGATLVGLFTALPQALVAVVSGLALLGAFLGGLTQATEDPVHRESAVITFLVTVSGVSLLGVGSSFWGLLAGLLAGAVLVGPQARLQAAITAHAGRASARK
ncbi:benzoate/H(+) symporter BenE family transporter [Nitratidesulfovibrio sp. SRB-5]|uniref:benzoate/H(+) symporter BenE family transporter n=1 Tax=Nitratidesulfovibrio sp. SRB-5 TaxID=2872636 RepID=UPI0010262096|nr:benzoate/H(+) symporter BenE family transporter [Nitratidesulfovibrio sp. SRB-5]MBZ2173591.1 benzoate/H(+) symporter BenE family transporter [Nitratidesulfovibrio sp. SRB-5]RXF74875.1 benzoate transporter BenE [Desulfovibrio sp. DS-1]